MKRDEVQNLKTEAQSLLHEFVDETEDMVQHMVIPEGNIIEAEKKLDAIISSINNTHQFFKRLS